MRRLMGYTSRFLIFISISALIVGCVATEALMKGEKAYQTGDYDRAIKDFKSCVDSEGDTGEYASHCSFMLGMAYFDKGQYPEAITYLKRAIDVYKKGMYVFRLDYAWPFWLGRAYFENKQYREAIVYFDEAGSSAPKNPATLMPDYATEWRKYYLPLIPSKGDCYIWLGHAYYRDAQYQEAVGAYKKSIELKPSETYAYANIAAAYRKLKQYDEALAAAKRAIETKPSAFVYGVLGDIYSDQKKYNDAIDAYKKAIELNPKEISHYFKLSNLYTKKDDYASAIAINQKAQAMAPENADIPFAIANLYMYMGKFDEAISSLNKAVSLSTITGIGTEITIEGSYPVVKAVNEAGPAKMVDIEVGDKIIKINRESSKGWDLNKVIQRVRGDEGTQVTLTIERKGMDKHIEKAVTRKSIIFKKAASFLALRSLAYREKHNLENATNDAEKAYSLDPNDNNAKEALGAVYIDKGRYDEAIKMLSTAQNDSFARILEATAYAKSAKYKEAVDIYSNIPEDYLITKAVLRKNNLNAFYASLKPYVSSRIENAKSLESKGSYEEALNEYAKILKVSNEDDANDIMGKIAILIKARPTIAELPEEARRHVMRAEASTKDGKFEDAVKEYKEAIKIAPYFPVLYKAIALNHVELKQYRQAIKNMKTYIALYPNAPDIRAAKDEIYKWEFMMEKEGK